MSADRPRRLIRHGITAGLALWCVLGLAHTTLVLSRPGRGLILDRGGMERAIGIPYPPGGALVSDALDLLDVVPGAGPILVVTPHDMELAVREYLLYQLAALLYPRPVHAPEVHTPRPATTYDGAIAIGRASPGPEWTSAARRGDVTLFQPRRP